MEQAAGWIAPIATTIAAGMTALNLGPRLTGWGFVVFAVGAVAWGGVGLWTGQGNLVWQNAVLLAVDLVGVWRWLGREAVYARATRSAEAASRARPAPSLVSAKRLADADAIDASGAVIGRSVDAMLGCKDGRVASVVIREGGIGGVGETLRAVPWGRVRLRGERLELTLDAAALRRFPVFTPDTADAAR